MFSIRKILLFALILALAACEQTPVLERIKQKGRLLIATRNSPTTYYEGAQNPEGFEYELASAFAESQGLLPEFISFSSDSNIIKALKTGRVHMAAAGLSINNEKQSTLLYSIPYQKVGLQLLYRKGRTKPKNMGQLNGKLHIAADSGFQSKLEQLKISYPELHWSLTEHSNTDIMLSQLNDGMIDYTIADSNQLAANKSFRPYVSEAFSLPETVKHRWVFPPSFDTTLQRAANELLHQKLKDGSIDLLAKKHYVHLPTRNFVDNRDFWRNVSSRLPKYQYMFEWAEKETGLDWRLLAAIGYQESHWNPKAVSPTGVRGIMMLTQETAKQLGVTNRMDPKQSIFGGAQHLIWMKQRIPERIQGDDRLWFGLAAYNIGYGHLEDTRILTQRQGGDPDKWEDVKQRLPLLKKKKYYSTLKRGYARGGEPVAYVANVQYYYRMMIYLSNR